VNESLLHLYELQKVDSQLDDLIESRGELPERVDEMRGTVEEQRRNLKQMREEVADLEKRSREMSDESIDLREKVERYKAQQFDVKTTREYDAITFQLEDSQKRLSTNIESVSRMGLEAESLRQDEQQLTADLEQMETDLKDAEAALKDVLAETESDERDLRARRADLEKKVERFHLTIYNRVRPAKAGVAVVAVKHGVCGGCYNAVPRQVVLELKKGDRHTVCEYCGRIIVGEPIAIAVDGEPQEVHYETDEETESED
jgi:predicted  nucleic acid-binding Zn-ribbon protein